MRRAERGGSLPEEEASRRCLGCMGSRWSTGDAAVDIDCRPEVVRRREYAAKTATPAVRWATALGGYSWPF